MSSLLRERVAQRTAQLQYEEKTNEYINNNKKNKKTTKFNNNHGNNPQNDDNSSGYLSQSYRNRKRQLLSACSVPLSSISTSLHSNNHSTNNNNTNNNILSRGFLNNYKRDKYIQAQIQAEACYKIFQFYLSEHKTREQAHSILHNYTKNTNYNNNNSNHKTKIVVETGTQTMESEDDSTINTIDTLTSTINSLDHSPFGPSTPNNAINNSTLISPFPGLEQNKPLQQQQQQQQPDIIRKPSNTISIMVPSPQTVPKPVSARRHVEISPSSTEIKETTQQVQAQVEIIPPPELKVNTSGFNSTDIQQLIDTLETDKKLQDLVHTTASSSSSSVSPAVTAEVVDTSANADISSTAIVDTTVASRAPFLATIKEVGSEPNSQTNLFGENLRSKIKRTKSPEPKPEPVSTQVQVTKPIIEATNPIIQPLALATTAVPTNNKQAVITTANIMPILASTPNVPVIPVVSTPIAVVDAATASKINDTPSVIAAPIIPPISAPIPTIPLAVVEIQAKETTKPIVTNYLSPTNSSRPVIPKLNFTEILKSVENENKPQTILQKPNEIQLKREISIDIDTESETGSTAFEAPINHPPLHISIPINNETIEVKNDVNTTTTSNSAFLSPPVPKRTHAKQVSLSRSASPSNASQTQEIAAFVAASVVSTTDNNLNSANIASVNTQYSNNNVNNATILTASSTVNPPVPRRTHAKQLSASSRSNSIESSNQAPLIVSQPIKGDNDVRPSNAPNSSLPPVPLRTHAKHKSVESNNAVPPIITVTQMSTISEPTAANDNNPATVSNPNKVNSQLSSTKPAFHPSLGLPPTNPNRSGSGNTNLSVTESSSHSTRSNTPSPVPGPRPPPLEEHPDYLQLAANTDITPSQSTNKPHLTVNTSLGNSANPSPRISTPNSSNKRENNPNVTTPSHNNNPATSTKGRISFSFSHSLKEGFLSIKPVKKKGSWQRVYCILKPTALNYYVNRTPASGTDRCDVSIYLAGGITVIKSLASKVEGQEFVIELKPDSGQDYWLVCGSESDRTSWVDALKSVQSKYKT